jgi:hypothetical protein
MMGFFGSDVGPGATSDSTKDWPRHIPVESTRKLINDFRIIAVPRKIDLATPFRKLS